MNKTTTRIDNPEVAEVLVNPKASRVLASFMEREQSLSEAAAELNVKLPGLSYWVNKLIDLNLLEVVREKPRRGRAVKIYGTTAEAFFVPFEMTSSESLDSLLVTLLQEQGEQYVRGLAYTLQRFKPTWGVRISRDEDGRVNFSLTHEGQVGGEVLHRHWFDPQAPAVFGSDGDIKLDFATAKAMQRDLHDLWQRYIKQQHENGQRYSYRLGITPIQDK